MFMINSLRPEAYVIPSYESTSTSKPVGCKTRRQSMPVVLSGSDGDSLDSVHVRFVHSRHHDSVDDKVVYLIVEQPLEGIINLKAV